MNQEPLNSHLSQIATMWSVVCRAHEGAGESLASARRTLLERYGGAVRRYLLGALRDSDAADELFQEFALRFVRGDFHRADPERGRFRDFVKTALYRMVVQHFRRLKGKPGPLPTAVADRPADDVALNPSLANSDGAFAQNWKDELLARAWSALEAFQQNSGQPLFTVLRFRADYADMSSTEMAEQLSVKLGKSLSAAGVRQTLHRARDKFAELLLDEVSESLETPTAELLEEELIDLGLLEYCRPALKRRFDSE